MKYWVLFCLALSTVAFELSPPEMEFVRTNVTVTNRHSLVRVSYEFEVHNTADSSGQIRWGKDVARLATFTLPVPRQAVVDTLQLRIADEWRDGVTTDPANAEKALGEIMTRRKDPALVTYRSRSAYNIRLYPVPFGRTRQLRVSFVYDMADLPDFVPQVPSCRGDLRVNLADLSEGSLRNQGTGAEWAVAQDGKLDAAVSLPDAREIVLSARALSEFVLIQKLKDSTAVRLRTQVPEPKRIEARRVSFLWDASRSRAGSNDSQVLALLADWLEQHQAELRVGVFRHSVQWLEQPGTSVSLQNQLAALSYRGLTRFEPLVTEPPPDFYILLSDGVAESYPHFNAPVFLLADDPPDAARAMVSASGGTCLGLGASELVPQLGMQPLSWLGLRGDQELVFGITPATANGTTLDIIFLLREPGLLYLDCSAGYEGAPIQLPARSTGGVGAYWLGKRGFSSDTAAQAAELGVVTPWTTQIVLENLQQYILYGIRPPDSKRAWQQAYDFQTATAPASLQQGPSTLSKYIHEHRGMFNRWRSSWGWINQDSDIVPSDPVMKLVAFPVPAGNFGSDPTREGINAGDDFGFETDPQPEPDAEPGLSPPKAEGVEAVADSELHGDIDVVHEEVHGVVRGGVVHDVVHGGTAKSRVPRAPRHGLGLNRARRRVQFPHGISRA